MGYPANQKERMIAGLPYLAWKDGLPEARARAQALCQQYNRTAPDETEARARLLDQLLGAHGADPVIEPNFRCDYGFNITVGDNFGANYDCIFLDVAPITIGDNVLLAPRVGLYTAGHPLHAGARDSGYEYGRPITIGDSVWLGAGAIVCPGVSIGSRTVVGAGSVVRRDLPEGVLAAGNPCRVIRPITEEDARYYFKDLPFDVDWQA